MRPNPQTVARVWRLLNVFPESISKNSSSFPEILGGPKSCSWPVKSSSCMIPQRNSSTNLPRPDSAEIGAIAAADHVQRFNDRKLQDSFVCDDIRNSKVLHPVQSLEQDMVQAIEQRDFSKCVQVFVHAAKHGHQLSALAFNSLLSACAAAGDVECARAATAVMKAHGLSLTEDSHFELVRAMCMAGQLREAMAHLHKMFSEGSMSPSARMINLVLGLAARKGSREQSVQCIRWMQQHSITPDASTACALMRLEGRLGQASEVQMHWEQARAGGVGASPAAHAARVVALVTCLRSRPRSRSKNRATPPDEYQLGMVHSALDDMVVAYQASKQACARTDTHRAREPLEETQAAWDAHHTWRRYMLLACNSVLSSHADVGGARQAHTLLSRMHALHLSPDSFTYNELLRVELQHASPNWMERTGELVQSMVAHGVHMNAHIYSSLIAAHARNDNLTEAKETMLRAQSQGVVLGEHAFHAVLSAAARAGDLEEAARVRHDMTAAGWVPNQCTFSLLLSAVANQAAHAQRHARGGREARVHREASRRVLHNIEQEMEALGVVHNAVSFNALLKAYDATGQQELMTNTFVSPPEGVQPDVISYTNLMHAFLRENRIEEVFQLKAQMEDQGIQGDLITYNRLIEACVSSCDVDFALGLMDELQKSNLTPDIYTFNSLIKVMVAGGDFNIVAMLLQTMQASGIEPNDTTWRIINTAAQEQGQDGVMEVMYSGLNA